MTSLEPKEEDWRQFVSARPQCALNSEFWKPALALERAFIDKWGKSLCHMWWSRRFGDYPRERYEFQLSSAALKDAVNIMYDAIEELYHKYQYEEAISIILKALDWMREDMAMIYGNVKGWYKKNKKDDYYSGTFRREPGEDFHDTRLYF